MVDMAARGESWPRSARFRRSSRRSALVCRHLFVVHAHLPAWRDRRMSRADVQDMPNDLSYILNHLGEDRASYFGAVAPPIVQSSIFAFPTVDAMRAGFRDEFG